MNIDPKVDEAVETLNMKNGPTRRRLLSGAGLGQCLAAAAGSWPPARRAPGLGRQGCGGNFPKTPRGSSGTSTTSHEPVLRAHQSEARICERPCSAPTARSGAAPQNSADRRLVARRTGSW